MLVYQRVDIDLEIGTDFLETDRDLDIYDILVDLRNMIFGWDGIGSRNGN